MSSEAELDKLFPVNSEDLSSLEARLIQKAGEQDEIDVAYRVVDSPIGRLLVAGTDAGLVRVAFESEGFDSVVETLAKKISPRVLNAPARLDQAAREIEQYFAGERLSFEVPVDFRLSAGFRRDVQTYLPHIPYGQTETYKQVAEHVGNPKAVRAVGSACAKNPLPVVVPCHRVLRTDGGLGGYLGGTEAKKLLLDLEHSTAA
ncbi:methylated-DNA--[protein]-cysteine S-methyltransferase [Corynebacterium lubricantis]|uniref:methylated-DNA--[protein]-cysteine S-methyltransferase n=1 Tax=Corynebacterium lubricantis TaxID=541095 RepID=UPI000365CF7A|nr:methylated-DNA--[protein]-cysteine S-methyltransferase [Corynebacterium lubricantis]